MRVSARNSAPYGVVAARCGARMGPENNRTGAPWQECSCLGAPVSLARAACPSAAWGALRGHAREGYPAFSG